MPPIFLRRAAGRTDTRAGPPGRQSLGSGRPDHNRPQNPRRRGLTALQTGGAQQRTATQPAGIAQDMGQRSNSDRRPSAIVGSSDACLSQGPPRAEHCQECGGRPKCQLEMKAALHVSQVVLESREVFLCRFVEGRAISLTVNAMRTFCKNSRWRVAERPEPQPRVPCLLRQGSGRGCGQIYALTLPASSREASMAGMSLSVSRRRRLCPRSSRGFCPRNHHCLSRRQFSCPCQKKHSCNSRMALVTPSGFPKAMRSPT